MVGIVGNYDVSQLKNPVTGQLRCIPQHDFQKTLYNASVDSGNTVYSDPIDTRADAEKTVFVQTTKLFTVTVQVTDDDGANPDWYDACDSDGNVISQVVNATHKAIPVSIKSIAARVKAVNNDSTAGTLVIHID